MNLVACTPAPTLAPTNVGELPICNFNAGFCDWAQDADDHFDWALTSEGTPTSNTGPNDGSGHGGGAFIHIEANGQTEGAYAAITSSATGCGLYVDYHMYGGGIGSLTVSAKDVVDDAAWVPRCGQRRGLRETAGRLRPFTQHQAASTGSLPHAVGGIAVTLLSTICM